MHSSNHGKTTFNHNGDYSGRVIVYAMDEHAQGAGAIQVPMADLIAFVAQYVRDRRQSAIEDASDNEVLGLK